MAFETNINELGTFNKEHTSEITQHDCTLKRDEEAEKKKVKKEEDKDNNFFSILHYKELLIRFVLRNSKT